MGQREERLGGRGLGQHLPGAVEHPAAWLDQALGGLFLGLQAVGVFGVVVLEELGEHVEHAEHGARQQRRQIPSEASQVIGLRTWIFSICMSSSFLAASRVISRSKMASGSEGSVRQWASARSHRSPRGANGRPSRVSPNHSRIDNAPTSLFSVSRAAVCFFTV